MENNNWGKMGNPNSYEDNEWLISPIISIRDVVNMKDEWI